MAAPNRHFEQTDANRLQQLQRLLPTVAGTRDAIRELSTRADQLRDEMEDVLARLDRMHALLDAFVSEAQEN